MERAIREQAPTSLLRNFIPSLNTAAKATQHHRNRQKETASLEKANNQSNGDEVLIEPQTAAQEKAAMATSSNHLPMAKGR